MPFPTEVLVKVEVQGFDEEVIARGRGELTGTPVVMIESTHGNLYQGRPPFDQVYEEMRGPKVNFSGTWNKLFSPQKGTVLASDIVFIKPVSDRRLRSVSS